MLIGINCYPIADSSQQALAVALKPTLQAVRIDRDHAAATAWSRSQGLQVVSLLAGARDDPVAALGDIIEWDNEPYYNGWGGGSPAAYYQAARNAGAAAYKASVSGKPFIVPFLMQSDGGDVNVGGVWTSNISLANAAAPDIWDNIDGLAVHPYPGPHGPEVTLSMLDKARAQLQAIGGRAATLPFHLTEIGWTQTGEPGVSEASTAGWVTELLQWVGARSDVASLFYYKLKDGPNIVEQEIGFGLFTEAGNAKMQKVSFAGATGGTLPPVPPSPPPSGGGGGTPGPGPDPVGGIGAPPAAILDETLGNPDNHLTAATMNSVQAAQRADVSSIYSGPKEPVLGVQTKFRVTAIIADSVGKTSSVPLQLIERITWEDANAITTGEITLRMNPFDPTAGENRLDQGDRIRLEAKIGSLAWQEVWTLRCYSPQLTASNVQRTFQLVNDLDLLRQSEDNFYYRASGPDIISGGITKPGGWTGPEVIADVCRRYKVPLTCYTVPAAQKIGKIRVKRGSPLAVIRNVVLRERRRHNRRLAIHWYKGRLYVLPLKRSATLLSLGPTLIEAAFASQLPDQFGSAITMHGLQEFVYGQDSGGTPVSKRQKMHLELENDLSRKLFGYVHRIVFSPDAKSDADLRTEGFEYLQAVMLPHRTLTLTHDGMPFLRRGDAIQLALGDPGLQKQLLWVNTVQHVVTPQGYTMDFAVVFDDPYRDRREETLIFKLKATAAEAIGNRNQTNPFWYLSSQKDDASVVGATDGGYTVVNPGDPISSDNTGGY